MQNAELRDLQLTSKWRSYLIKAGFLTASEVLLTSPQELVKKTRLAPNDVTQLLLEVAAAATDQPNSRAWTVSSHPSCSANHQDSNYGASEAHAPTARHSITLGDDGIDLLLGEGIQLGTLTEIAGQSGAGKSHLGLQLALAAQLPPSRGGVSGGTLLISSEGMIPSSRLLDLARHVLEASPFEEQTLSPWDLLDNVHTEKADDVETLDSLLNYVAPAFIERVNAAAAAGTQVSRPNGDSTASAGQHHSRRRRPALPIKVVIIDSIAAPFRGSHGSNSAGFAQRAKDFGNVGNQLKRLAHVYDCAVVVVNQISDAFFRGSNYAFLAQNISRTNSPSSRSALSNGNGGSNLALAQLQQPSSSPRPDSVCSGLPKPAHEQFNLPEMMYSRFQTKHFSGQTPVFPSVAALGHSWSNVVNTRIMMRKGKRRKIEGYEAPERLSKMPHRASQVEQQQSQGQMSQLADDDGKVLVRHMTLVFSPFAERASLEYVIDESGVRSLSFPSKRASRWQGNNESDFDGVGQTQPRATAPDDAEINHVEGDEAALWATVGLDALNSEMNPPADFELDSLAHAPE
ncbi:DNA repair protein rhp57 [Microbotryomycetes sp. JL221]|nr:DNA repair protein rhp57 [Microbotryomycetes sp. JL221]